MVSPKVTIDGVPTLANRLPSGPASRALLDQYRPEHVSQQRIPIATGLPDRLHELELVVTGRQHESSAGPSVGVDAILIGRARPLGPYLITGGVWGAALLALLWRVRPLAAAQPRATAGPAPGTTGRDG